MYELNPERNSEYMPPFNHKTALTSNVWKNGFDITENPFNFVLQLLFQQQMTLPLLYLLGDGGGGKGLKYAEQIKGLGENPWWKHT